MRPLAWCVLNRGFTAPIVMGLGGWKTERMMRRYAAVTDVTLRAAAEAVSGTQNAPIAKTCLGRDARSSLGLLPYLLEFSIDRSRHDKCVQC